MPLKIFKRGKVWYVRGTVFGEPIYETTGTTERARAETYRSRREAELWDSRVVGERETTTFADAALSYLQHEPRSIGTKKYVCRLMDHFCPGWQRDEVAEIGWVTCREIDQGKIDRCLTALLRTGAKPATRVRLINVLCAVLVHAAKRGWCDMPRIDRPKLPSGRTRWLTQEEAERLIKCAAPHLRPIIVFLLYTGARLSEALDLDWRDVDLSRSRVAFTNTKNGTHRGVPLHDRAKVELANLPHRTGKVFRRHDGQPFADRMRAEGGQIKNSFKTACRKAGLVDLHAHDLRHTWATWLYGESRNLFMIMELGGWKSQSMVQRYAHVNPDHLESAIQSLPKLVQNL